MTAPNVNIIYNVLLDQKHDFFRNITKHHHIPVQSIRGPLSILERYLIVIAVLVRHSSERKGGSATTTSNEDPSSLGTSSGER